MSKKRGITLIALIITIIVMLILVAVTITMAINGGLFGYAGNAAKGTNSEMTKERELSNVADSLTYDQLINKYSQNSAVTNLSGTTWVFKDNISIATLERDYNIDFSAYNSTFDTPISNTMIVKDTLYNYDFIRFHGESNDFAFIPENDLSFPQGWVMGNLGTMQTQSTSAPTISIIGGQDAADTGLIEWLQENATKQN